MYKNFISFTLLVVFNCTCLWSQQNKNLSFHFQTNESIVSNSEKEKLIEIIDSIRKDAYIIAVNINGYCDDIGTVDDNKVLSLKRAQHTMRLLPKELQTDSVVSYLGNGEQMLLHNSTSPVPEQRANNRRVDISISYLPILDSKTEEQPILVGDHKIGDKIVLKGILFKASTAILLPESHQPLENLLSALQEKTKYYVQIQGHIFVPRNAHSTYDPNAKITLSEKRANKIYTYLIKNGINEERLSWVGFEGKYPLNKGPKYDRRVEIEIVDIKQ